MLQARQRGPEEGVTSQVRLGVIAGQRFSGAVARNRAKRLLRETCRVLLGRTRAPWDLLLVARPEVLESSFSQRLEGLGKLLRQAGVLGEEATRTA